LRIRAPAAELEQIDAGGMITAAGNFSFRNPGCRRTMNWISGVRDAVVCTRRVGAGDREPGTIRAGRSSNPRLSTLEDDGW
jgi:hypothetical protein